MPIATSHRSHRRFRAEQDSTHEALSQQFATFEQTLAESFKFAPSNSQAAENAALSGTPARERDVKIEALHSALLESQGIAKALNQTVKSMQQRADADRKVTEDLPETKQLPEDAVEPVTISVFTPAPGPTNLAPPMAKALGQQTAFNDAVNDLVGMITAGQNGPCSPEQLWLWNDDWTNGPMAVGFAAQWNIMIAAWIRSFHNYRGLVTLNPSGMQYAKVPSSALAHSMGTTIEYIVHTPCKGEWHA